MKTTFLETLMCSIVDMPLLEGVASQHTFQPGQILFYAGHMPYGLFILAQGEVETTYLIGGEKRVQSGALLGISAFVNQLPYSATVKALTKCQVYFLSKGTYFRLKSENHPIMEWIENQIRLQ